MATTLIAPISTLGSTTVLFDKFVFSSLSFDVLLITDVSSHIAPYIKVTTNKVADS